MRAILFFLLWCIYLWAASWYVHTGIRLVWTHSGMLAVLSLVPLVYLGVAISNAKLSKDS